VHRLVLAALLGCLATTPLTAQGRPSLEQRLDPRTLAALRPILDSARGDSVPVQALEDKALEGVAKHVPLERIVAAVRQLAAELRDVRTILRSVAPGVTSSDGEIVAAADARRRGVPATDVVALRSHAPPTSALVVAYTVFGDLVQRGVPADQARLAIEQLLAAGVPAQQIAEIPARMDVGLRVGAPPLDALRSALPMPLRPVKPPPAGASPPKPNLSGPGVPQP
jgi:hypothetical protein